MEAFLFSLASILDILQEKWRKFATSPYTCTSLSVILRLQSVFEMRPFCLCKSGGLTIKKLSG